MAKSLVRAGNIKMRGKRHLVLTCSCCECIDFRSRINDKVTRTEIKEYKQYGSQE